MDIASKRPYQNRTYIPTRVSDPDGVDPGQEKTASGLYPREKPGSDLIIFTLNFLLYIYKSI